VNENPHSRDLLKVGNLTVEPGAKVAGVEELNVGGNLVRFPIFIVNGARPGPTLAVTAGIHGAEFASIEAALQVGRAAAADCLAGRLVIVAVANMPAFLARSIGVVLFLVSSLAMNEGDPLLSVGA
jgi:predicted deacylase